MKSSTQCSDRSISPSPEPSSYTTTDKQESTPPLLPSLALQISSCPVSPTPTPVTNEMTNNDPICIQITEGQWITSSSSCVLIQHSCLCSPSTHCYICSDLGHHGLFCPMYICSTCGESAPGHAAHHCLATQCDLCLRWGHSDDICNLRICGRCDTSDRACGQ